ncbi:hydroxylysine kinase-like [Glandiceps talaboti]
MEYADKERHATDGGALLQHHQQFNQCSTKLAAYTCYKFCIHHDPESPYYNNNLPERLLIMDAKNELCIKTNKQQPVNTKDDGKPKLSIAYAEELANKMSGLKIECITELDSYYDRSYHITGRVDQEQAQLVMKIINTVESKNIAFFNGVVQLLFHLREKGIKCPQPYKQVTGDYLTFHQLQESGHHLVYFLTYLDGVRVNQIVNESPSLYYSVGTFLAELDIALQDFHYDIQVFEAENRLVTAWKLENLSAVRSYLHLIEDKDMLKTITCILESFENEVLPNYKHLRKGLIHRDFTAFNVIIKAEANSLQTNECRCSSEKKYHISGVIDFQAVTCSFYVFEIAIAIAHFIMESKTQDPETVRNNMLSGFESKFSLTDCERALLDVCIAGRMVQMVAMGLGNMESQPYNEYMRDMVLSAIKKFKQIYC